MHEVDVGIGGGVTEVVVGALLKNVGVCHQVLCITPLPQVAAQGHQHLRVSKQSVKGVTLSKIETLDKIARMLGGVEITETTRAICCGNVGAALSVQRSRCARQ